MYRGSWRGPVSALTAHPSSSRRTHRVPKLGQRSIEHEPQSTQWKCLGWPSSSNFELVVYFGTWPWFLTSKFELNLGGQPTHFHGHFGTRVVKYLPLRIFDKNSILYESYIMSHKMLFMRYDAYDMHVFRQLKVHDKLRMKESSFSVAVIDSRSSRSLKINHTLNTNVHNNRPDITWRNQWWWRHQFITV